MDPGVGVARVWCAVLGWVLRVGGSGFGVRYQGLRVHGSGCVNA